MGIYCDTARDNLPGAVAFFKQKITNCQGKDQRHGEEQEAAGDTVIGNDDNNVYADHSICSSRGRK